MDALAHQKQKTGRRMDVSDVSARKSNVKRESTGSYLNGARHPRTFLGVCEAVRLQSCKLPPDGSPADVTKFTIEEFHS